MKKFLTLLLLTFSVVALSAQTKEDVAKAVLLSFKQKNTEFFKYFIPGPVLQKYLEKEKSFRQMDSAVAEGLISWEELSLEAKFDSTANTKEEFMKMTAEQGKKEVKENWELLIKRHWNCYGASADTTQATLIIEKQHGEEMYFAAFKGKNKFAIKLSIEKDGDNYWVVDVSPTIRLQDPKGKFTCQAQCTNGKGSAFMCN